MTCGGGEDAALASSRGVQHAGQISEQRGGRACRVEPGQRWSRSQERRRDRWRAAARRWPGRRRRPSRRARARRARSQQHGRAALRRRARRAAAAACEAAAKASASVARRKVASTTTPPSRSSGGRRALAEFGVDGLALAVAVRARRGPLVRVEAGAQLADAVRGEHGAPGRRGERLGKRRLAAGGQPGHADHRGAGGHARRSARPRRAARAREPPGRPRPRRPAVRRAGSRPWRGPGRARCT